MNLFCFLLLNVNLIKITNQKVSCYYLLLKIKLKSIIKLKSVIKFDSLNGWECGKNLLKIFVKFY